MDRNVITEVARLAAPEAAALLAPLADAGDRRRAPRPEPVGRRGRPPGARRRETGAVIAAAPPDEGRQWARNLTYPDDSVGRIMEPPHAVFRPAHRGGDGRAHPGARQDHARHLRVRRGRGGRPAGRRGHAGPPARRARRPPRRRHAARALLAPAGDAAPRGGAARRGPPLPGLPGVRLDGPARRDRARPDPLRGAGARDQRPGRHHGRRREGGAALDPVVAQPPLPPPLAPAQPAHRVRRGGRGRRLPGHDRQARRPGRVPAGAGRPVRQHRLSGPRGDAPRPDPRRAAPRQRRAGSS